MRVASTRDALHEQLARQAGRVALVPTMGALHDGHLALVDAARSAADVVVVSIFVNPLQFGAGEDLDAYPRTFDADLDACERRGVDVVFAPSVDVVYPGGDPDVRVDPGPLATELEGAVRPGHFAGVLTVVAKLFGLVQPQVAVFGTKDYQQLTLVRALVRDLCIPIELVGVETVREPDGMALSSRNRYLSDDERMTSAVLSRALRAGVAAAAGGRDGVLTAAHEVLATEPSVRLDYLALRSPDLRLDSRGGESRLLVAARVGSTRLIDNVGLELPVLDDHERPTRIG